MCTMKREYIKPLIFLHILLAIYSLGGISSKLAGQQEFLSFKFCLYYSIVLLILFIYALLWQQVLKKLPLVTAFANKAVIIIWGIIWGAVFFEETITLSKIIGAFVIVVGVCLVVCSDENKEAKEEV